MVACRTIALEAPAQAEIVLEGYVDPRERRLEGPFGDHTGYYSLAREYPVFHLTAITRRARPIYPTTIVGRPPEEDYWLGKATERLFVPIVRLLLPEVVDINMPAEGVFHNLVIDAIEKGALDDVAQAWPEEIVMSDEIRELVTRRWKDYGL